LLYAEDMPVDRRFDLGTYTVSADEIKAFATLWDPLPMHVDEEAAAATPFGGLIASGVHTIAIANRLAAEAVISQTALLAGRGGREMRLLKPVRPDTRLTGSLQILENELRDNGRGYISWRIELADDAGDTVYSIIIDCIVHRRPAA
jgi:acyl dehydratase